jgi:hypothetical protein
MNYVLTESDKQEIAGIASELVKSDINPGFNVTYDGHGGVTITSAANGGLNVTDDGNGNVTITM